MNLLLSIINTISAWFTFAYNWVITFYEQMVGYWPLQNVLELKYALLILLALIIALIIIIAIVKKKKVKYYIDGKLYFCEKVKYGKQLNFPVVEKAGKVFDGWYIGKKAFKKYLGETLNRNSNLKLYAKYKTIGEDRVSIGKGNDVFSATVEEIKTSDLGKFYDEIRYEMLSYERATPFKNVGVVRKLIVAEMFEKDGVINLYLALDPELVKEKGYNVETYTQPEFSIVPCKKIIANEEDLLEAIKLVKEAMIINNFVKSEHRRIDRVKSDESIRRKGFAFYVKNDNVVTSASDYYKLLRAMVLSYSPASGTQITKQLENKMILKIFKKDEQIFLYLALDAEKEGLEFVGYDKNFADTPSKFEITVADSLVKANYLIDKLMFRFGMEKHPETAELLIDEEIKTNCGFGYRIKR